MIHMSGIGLYFQIFNLERIWRVKATFYSNTYIQLGFIETCSVATKKNPYSCIGNGKMANENDMK